MKKKIEKKQIEPDEIGKELDKLISKVKSRKSALKKITRILGGKTDDKKNSQSDLHLKHKK